jgi:hypothetical protein
MRRWGMCCALSVGAFAAEPALASNCATVTFSPASVSLPSYNPIGGAAVQATFTATIRRADRATQEARMIFTDSDDVAAPVKLGVVSGTSGPTYQVLGPGGVNVAFPKNTNVTAQTTPFVDISPGPSGDTVSASYTVNIPVNSGNTDLRNGTYSEFLSYSIQCFTSNGKTSKGVDGPLSGPSLSLVVPSLVSLTTASPATIDFQNFTSLTQQLNVGLKSTGPVNVAIDSTNKLKMVRSGASSPYPDNSRIDYLLSLRGNNVASLPGTLTNQPRAGVGGTTWPLVLSLPATPSGKIAGSYSDTITLTLTPGT